jgi:hypothetical protein
VKAALRRVGAEPAFLLLHALGAESDEARKAMAAKAPAHSSAKGASTLAWPWRSTSRDFQG